MTGPMIEQTSADVEEFIDDLTDEALDRMKGTSFWCGWQHQCTGPDR